MTDETSDLVLEHLRRLRGSVDGMHEDPTDFRQGMSAVGQGLGNLTIHVGQSQVVLGSVNKRVDRIDERTERVERKLDLVDA